MVLRLARVGVAFVAIAAVAVVMEVVVGGGVVTMVIITCAFAVLSLLGRVHID